MPGTGPTLIDHHGVHSRCDDLQFGQCFHLWSFLLPTPTPTPTPNSHSRLWDALSNTRYERAGAIARVGVGARAGVRVRVRAWRVKAGGLSIKWTNGDSLSV